MTSRRLVIGLIVWLSCQIAGAVYANQDPVSSVRELYLSADYEGALAVLDRLDGATRDSHAELADYRVLCLLALDHRDEARQAIRAIVERDPAHRLSDVQASPRMQSAFQEMRKALLPEIVQRMYADAKAAFDKHDPSAADTFDRLMVLLDDPDLKDAQLSDLRAVASGFRDLSKAAHAEPAQESNSEEVRPKPNVTSEPKPVVTPAQIPPPPSRPEGATALRQAQDRPEQSRGTATLAAVNGGGGRPNPTYDESSVRSKPAGPLTGPPDKLRVTPAGSSPVFSPKAPPPAGVEPAVAVSQPMPQWSRRWIRTQQNYDSVLELTIDERGNVTAVALQQPMHPTFDKALLKLARTWKYTPARLNGTPAPFLKLVEIHIEPDR